MLRIYLKLGLALLYSFCIVLGTASLSMAYDSSLVANYAKKWIDSYNPEYFEYVSGGGEEDANFVSQVYLSANKWSDSPVKDWLTDDLDCFVDKMSLFNHLKEYEHTEVSSAAVEIPDNLSVGDVIFFGDEGNPLKLVGVVTGAYGDEWLISYHNPESGGIVGEQAYLSSLLLVYGGATYCHFVRKADTGDKIRFYGTGGFQGPGALSAHVIDPGANYQGYIVQNPYGSEQDMVIATDTSNKSIFKGCSYTISGYCCDRRKDAPSPGRPMGVPWTSDSRGHWAYWVKRAVLYAEQQGMLGDAVQDAVWYITDGNGRASDVYVWSQNSILKSINFPKGGPSKGSHTLENGSFEEGNELPNPWLGNRLGRKDGRTCSTASAGSCSFKIQGKPKTKKYLMQMLEASGEAGTSFTFSAASKTKKAKRGRLYSIELWIYHTDGSKQKCRGAFKPKGKKWTTKQITCSAKEVFEQAALVLNYSKQRGTAWFDNVEVSSSALSAQSLNKAALRGLSAEDKQR